MFREKLYKKDNKGGVRVWWAEIEPERYRTHSGLVEGKITQSGWTYPIEKNVGKANATSIEQQVVAEVNSMYVYQLNQGKYHASIDTIDSGANYIECQLAEKFNMDRHNQYPYIAQPKLNGARGLGVDRNLQTRNGKEIVSCPHINCDVRSFQEKFPDYILDGELYNHKLHDKFELLMTLIRKTKGVTEEHIMETEENVFFYVYDVITPIEMTVEERIKFLEDNVYDKYPSIRRVEHTVVNDIDETLSLLDKYIADGYEGLMLRNKVSLYQNKRTHDLVKVKKFMDEEVTILDIIEGKG